MFAVYHFAESRKAKEMGFHLAVAHLSIILIFRIIERGATVL